MTGSPRFYELLEVMRDTHSRKNADYSPGDDPFRNFRESEFIGVPAWVGAWIRLSDKYVRIQGLIAQYTRSGMIAPAVVNERIDDTLLDLANYSLLVLCMYEEYNAREDVSNQWNVANYEEPENMSVHAHIGMSLYKESQMSESERVARINRRRESDLEAEKLHGSTGGRNAEQCHCCKAKVDKKPDGGAPVKAHGFCYCNNCASRIIESYHELLTTVGEANDSGDFTTLGNIQITGGRVAGGGMSTNQNAGCGS